jgi:hypothetical protein
MALMLPAGEMPYLYILPPFYCRTQLILPTLSFTAFLFHRFCRAADLQMHINYHDGSSELIVTSSRSGGNSSLGTSRSASSAASWMATTAGNPIRYTHLHHGEIYDARLA